MGKSFHAVAIVIALVLVTFSVVFFAPSASAASRTWTTDVDFNEAGSVFVSTEVIGTGAAAKVELVKNVIDWANKNPPSPTPGTMEAPALAFDATGGVAVLFGGYTAGFPNPYSDKTWEYDFNANAWTEITSTPKPPGRQSAGLSYDPVQGVVVLFGGFNDTDFLADTWEYDVAANTWAQVFPPTSPPPLVDTPLAYHASASRHVTVGQSLLSGMMEMWAYDAGANTWANRNPTGMPSARSGFALAYSAVMDRTVLFGGSQLLTLYADTFEYNYGLNSWAPGATGPSARAAHSMTYRPASNSVLLFGGLTGAGVSQETWRYYDNAGTHTWEIVSTSNRPSARRYAGFTFDDGNDVGVLYGGVDASSSRLGDTWTLGAAYAAAGRYTSAVFDSGGSTDWWNLWWNLTAQPPSTFLRFQIATSDSPTGPWTYRGPSPACSTSGYYTTPGTAIGTCTSPPQNDGRRYLRFLADFGSTDTQVTPSMEDVTIAFAIIPAPPCIKQTDPPNITFGVLQTKVIVITFSEEMDTATVSWAVIQGYLDPSNFTAQWSQTNSVLSLTHPTWLLGENQVYKIRIFGMDLEGNSLSPTCPDGSAAAANPFIFVTQGINPTITEATPRINELNYPATAPMWIDFSEGMNTSSLVVTLTPTLAGGFNPVWTAGDSNVTLNHGTPFTKCIKYTVQIDATDKANLALIPGPVPNPYDFYSQCDDPYITAQSPTNFEMDVALNAPIVIDFSRPMQRSSVQVTFVPPIAGTSLAWTVLDMRLTITHSVAFPRCQVYTVTVAGQDTTGKSLIQNPIDPTIKNPWKFMTLCDNPSIMATVPEDGAVNVSVTQEILVAFSDMMIEASVSWTITGGPLTQMPPSWDASVLLHIGHTGFRQCTTYTVEVLTGRSQSGFDLVQGFAANPWSFSIVCDAPYVTDTNPPNATGLVLVTAPIWVNFTEAMDTPTVIFPINPPITLTPTWSNGDKTLLLTHAAPFVECQRYDIAIDGLGADTNSLLTGPGAPGAPNPWFFTTRCAGFYLIRTDPFDGEQDVPLTQSIVVEFSEPADPATFAFSLVPTLGLNPAWSNNNTVVTLSHSTPFPECIVHTATVDVMSWSGAPLIQPPGSAPNPWTFRTHCIPPEITSTTPQDGATGVPLDTVVVVNFSEAMLRSSVSWTFTPFVAGITSSWTNGDRTLSLAHSAAFLPITLYTVRIQGTDLQGNALVPGAVPNPWTFTTGQGLTPPGGLDVHRSPPNDLLLTWRTVPGASFYVIYHSINKFAPWPWAILQNDWAGTSFFHTGVLNDGLTHCYIVRAKDSSGGLSGNSTMGCKVPLSFTFSNSRSNVYWMSLPYNSIYGRASDISDELTSTRIDVIGKWDPVTQRTDLWYFFRGAWRGTNFPLNAGDGFYIGVRSSFQWVINGTDAAVPRTFTAYPAPNRNINWISLPFTATYARASDIVLDIEGGLGGGANTKILEVAKWDALTQTLMVFAWNPAGWSGPDFTIAPGEGLYLRVTSTFTWTPRLITPEVP